jgi:carbon-monoxide dehydrogenase iron sulfur subunit
MATTTSIRRVRYVGDGCVGCRLCAVMCAYYRTGSFNPKHGRIHVIKSEPATDYPVVCLHCDKPRCMDACIAGAIVRINHLIRIDLDKCTGCSTCINACGIGAIRLHPKLNKALKCDLCYDAMPNQEPPCVKYCPPRVLEVS